jgi:hypothetical protein
MRTPVAHFRCELDPPMQARSTGFNDDYTSSEVFTLQLSKRPDNLGVHFI